MKFNKPDPMCEDCGGTGWVHSDEYENGQIVGVATDSKPCHCTRQYVRDEELEPE